MEKDDRVGGRLDRGIELGEERRWERHKDTPTQRIKRNQ